MVKSEQQGISLSFDYWLPYSIHRHYQAACLLKMSVCEGWLSGASGAVAVLWDRRWSLHGLSRFTFNCSSNCVVRLHDSPWSAILIKAANDRTRHNFHLDYYRCSCLTLSKSRHGRRQDFDVGDSVGGGGKTEGLGSKKIDPAERSKAYLTD